MHHTQIVAIDEKFGDKGPYDVFVISVQADRIWTCRRRYSRFYKLFLAFVSATGEAIDFPPKLFKRANGAQLEERRKRLDVFLSTLCAHPAPAVQSLLSEFLSHSGLRPSVHDLGVSFDVDLTTARSGDDVDVAVAARAGAGEVGGQTTDVLIVPCPSVGMNLRTSDILQRLVTGISTRTNERSPLLVRASRPQHQGTEPGEANKKALDQQWESAFFIWLRTIV